MITSLRRLFGSALGKFLALAFVVLIGIGFALSDVTGNATFGGLGGANVARVGDTDIGVGELRESVRRAYNVARQDQPGLTMEGFIAAGGIDQVLDQLVQGAALRQFADEVGFGVSKRLVDGRIADLPVFAGMSGGFDQARFDSFLRENGMTERQIRDDIELQVLLEQFVVPVGDMPRISEGVAQPYAALLAEQRRGQAVFIPASSFAPATDPGDKALQTYLAQNKARYSVPERRIVEYALFDRSQVPVPAVTDAEIAAFYKANAARFAASETRSFAQVIAPDRATADAIAAKARGGSSLAAAAQASGLSAITTSDTNQQSFAAQTSDALATAAFAAARGEVVGPQQTDLGWVVARVEGVTGKPARNLAAATPEIRDTLAKRKASEAIVDYYNAIQDAANGGAAIEEIATDRKLTVVTTPAILPSGRAPDQPAFEMNAELAPIVRQAFQGEGEGEAQIATIVENEKFAVFAVKQVVAAAPPPFARIRPVLLADWRLAQGQKQARDKARAIVKAVEGGQKLGEAIRLAGPRVGTVQTIGGTRGEMARNGQRVPPELALLFSMAQGSVKTLEIPGNRGWMVIELAEVDRPDPKSVDKQVVAALANPLAQAFGNELAEQILAEAKRRAGVKINKELVAQLRNELTGATPVAQ